MKAEALETKKKMIREAKGLAESASNSAITKAQQEALETLALARAEAEVEAKSIRKKGESALKSFETSISRRKAKATQGVVGRLLGETR